MHAGLGVNLQELERYRYSRRSMMPWLSHGGNQLLFGQILIANKLRERMLAVTD
jgi:hypothetical protein